MTTTPTDATGAAPQTWVLRRVGDEEEMVPVGQGPASDSDLGFMDLLDVINPLQHLPIVGTIYRSLTGDTISDAARMAGGALYGGPFGLIGALANVIVEAETGTDIGGNALAWLEGDAGSDDAGSNDAVVAAAAQPATAAEPINAAPVATAAAFASPAAQGTAAQGTAAQGTVAQHGAPLAQPAAQVAAQVAAQASLHPAAHDLSPQAKPARTDFSGRSADRLDAFIQQASAVRRNNPLAVAHRPGSPGVAALAAAGPGAPGAIDITRLQTAAAKPPASASGGRGQDRPEPAELSLAGTDAGSVNDWMLQALDKYEHMRKQEKTS